MSKFDIEKWTVKELIDATSASPRFGKKVTIPEFQRSAVWPDKDRDALIVSIKNGYPFGSLLMYKENDETGEMKYYKLIDGLQRTHALKRYTAKRNLNIGFNDNRLNDKFIDFVAQELDRSSKQDKGKIRKRIRVVIVLWLRSIRGFTLTDGLQAAELIKTLVGKILKLEPDTSEFHTEFGRLNINKTFLIKLEKFLESVRKEYDISEVKIPVIIYTGASTELPTIFTRLNKQGKELGPYEILAAQWLDYRQPIKNEEIIDAIWKKYEILEKAGFSLDVSEQAPDEESRREREYTLFEYLFGLGQYLSKEFPLLFKPVRVDQPNPISFNLIPACLGLRLKDRGKLHEKTEDLNISGLEERILEAAEFVDSILKPVISIHQPRRARKHICHSDYQIISMIATAFQVRYDKSNLSEIDGWQDNRNALEKHILMRYLYDILRNAWGSSGDDTLFDTVKDLTYLNPPPTKEAWERNLDTWFNEKQMTLRHVRRKAPLNSAAILLLKYIYAHKFSDIEKTQGYDIEHIIPVGKLVSSLGIYDSYRDSYDDYRGPVNAISNLGFLEAGKNMAKGDQTFAEYLEKKWYSSHELTYGEYQDELQRYEEQLICKKELLPKLEFILHSSGRDSFEDFLKNRWERLKAEFIKAWRDYIPTE